MFSKTGIHALLALSALARQPRGTFLGASQIAKEIGAPRNYLGKLLKALADRGVLVSRKGKGGGFQLRRDPEEVSLYEVMDPIEKLSRWSGCFLGKERCSERNPCPLHPKWKVVRETYLAFLRTTSLAEVAARIAEAESGGRRANRVRSVGSQGRSESGD